MSCKIICVFCVAIFSVVFYFFLNDALFPSESPTVPEIKWFGPGQPKPEDETIKPFSIHVSDDVLKDLKRRLESDIPKLAAPVENVGSQYGINPDYLKGNKYSVVNHIHICT